MNLASPTGEYDCPGSQCFASPLMMVVLAALRAAAPPCASTACLTRSMPDCADAGCAAAALNASANAGKSIRNIISSIMIANAIGLRGGLSLKRRRYQHLVGPFGLNLYLYVYYHL